MQERKEAGSKVVRLFPFQDHRKTMVAFSLVKNTGVQWISPHYLFFSLVMGLEEAVHLSQLLIPSWWWKLFLLSHLEQPSAFPEVKREVGMGGIGPPTLQCFSTR